MTSINDHKFFFKHFQQLIERLFPELREELKNLENELTSDTSRSILFNKLLRELEKKYPQLFLEDTIYDESFKTKFSIAGVGELGEYVEEAEKEINKVDIFVKSLLSKSNQQYLAIRSRVKTLDSIMRKYKLKKRPYINDLIGFQIIVMESDRFSEIASEIFEGLDRKLEMFINLFSKTHEVQQKTIGINSVHHKALHFYFSYKHKFPVEIQIVPRYTFFWHQINHDTLYKQIKPVTYEEELTIRYYGYLCNNLDYYKILSNNL